MRSITIFFTAADGGTLRPGLKFQKLFAGGSRNNNTNRSGRADIEKTMNIRRMLRRVASSLVLLLLCVSAYGQQQRVAVPNISMPTLDGKAWSLKEEAGKVVVLNFWATWCEPCRTEVPYLVRLRSEFGKKGLAVAGVTLDEDLKVVEKFVAEYKVDYPILIPPAGSPWTKLENTPTTLLIDREGRLASKYIGAVPEEELRRDVEKLLAESRPD